MKHLALATTTMVTLVLIVLTLGCAGTAPASSQPQPARGEAPAPLSAARTFSLFGDDPTKDQAILDDMQQATQVYIAELVMAGQPVPEYEYAALLSIEGARQPLKELEEDWLSTQMAIAEYIMAGQPVPDYQYTALRSIIDARQAVLIRSELID